jgi:hypothetical protein
VQSEINRYAGRKKSKKTAGSSAGKEIRTGDPRLPQGLVSQMEHLFNTFSYLRFPKDNFSSIYPGEGCHIREISLRGLRRTIVVLKKASEFVSNILQNRCGLSGHLKDEFPFF